MGEKEPGVTRISASEVAAKEPNSVAVKIVAVAIVIVVGIFIYYAASVPAFDKSEQDATAQESANEPDIATTVDAELKEQLGVTQYSEWTNQDGVDEGSPLAAITSIGSIGDDTVRVFIQENLSKEESKQAGVRIFSLVGEQIPALDTVVVQASNGLDVNVFRKDVPLLNR